MTDDLSAPAGYRWLSNDLVLVCAGCGCLVADPARHNILCPRLLQDGYEWLCGRLGDTPDRDHREP